jgi:hypothetical protein
MSKLLELIRQQRQRGSGDGDKLFVLFEDAHGSGLRSAPSYSAAACSWAGLRGITKPRLQMRGARAMPRPDWSRPLPQPLVIPTVMTLRTLDDVRELMRHLPEENRSKAPWRYVASQLDKAATGKLDAVEVEIAPRLVLMLEGVKCRPR